jgi:hypothetical protein
MSGNNLITEPFAVWTVQPAEWGTGNFRGTTALQFLHHFHGNLIRYFLSGESSDCFSPILPKCEEMAESARRKEIEFFEAMKG